MKFDLGFGYPICVKEVLDLMYTPRIDNSIMTLDYPQYEGKQELINYIRSLTVKKYIIITNGATQAINIALRSFKKAENRSIVNTNQYTFPYYSFMINKADFEHRNNSIVDFKNSDSVLNLIDMPSNPYGIMHEIKDPFNNTIWDSVYNNKTYVNERINRSVDCRVEVNSVSKMLGISGVRIGWIATDSIADYNLFYKEIQAENCGLSVLSQDLVIDIFNKLDQEAFFTIAQGRVNYNRSEFLKLNSFLDGQDVPSNGMFYCAWVDNKGVDIIDKANVNYITLETELKRKLIRFNLAQNNEVTKKAIKAIQTADKLIK